MVAEKSSRDGFGTWVLGTLSVQSYGDDAGWFVSVPVKITVVVPPVLVAGLLHSVDGSPIGARA